MTFKTLRHKKYPDLFGHIEYLDGLNPCMTTSSTPLLQPETATMENELLYLRNNHDFNLADEIEEDYEMVTVKLEIVNK